MDRNYYPIKPDLGGLGAENSLQQNNQLGVVVLKKKIKIHISFDFLNKLTKHFSIKKCPVATRDHLFSTR
jgi:hypothetical protein